MDSMFREKIELACKGNEELRFYISVKGFVFGIQGRIDIYDEQAQAVYIKMEKNNRRISLQHVQSIEKVS